MRLLGALALVGFFLAVLFALEVAVDVAGFVHQVLAFL
jgi:hypothetical protein